MSLLNKRVTPVLSTSPKSQLFGLVEDSVNIDDVIDLDPDVGLRLAFLEAEHDVSRETLRQVQERRKVL